MSPEPAEIKGLDELVRGMPELLPEPLRREVLVPGARLARRTAAAHSPGSVAKSWSSKINRMSAAVLSSAAPGQVNTLESGRAAGAKAPPSEPLERWIAKSGFTGSAYVLARHIARRGRKGLFFIKRAKDTTTSALPGLIGKAAKSVEKGFSELGV